ncbi:MAG TPA: DUF3368 domain-containing protein [Ignavibacteriaceae bacterium]|nr:DUF3368 domain-containing protein [Ignavibacteriaceae bacterium]HRQ53405.1 DUF3368 domain-containing protein [Ignavibacteriaceae bacterium]
MPDIFIADTSCLIVLNKIDQLELLKNLYQTVLTTQDIQNEFGEVLPSWIEIKILKDKTRQLILELQLDKGEASAIALALEINNSTLIVDDFKARKIAEQLGLKITGTLGVLLKAKQQGLIELVLPFIENLKLNGFRISEELESEIKLLSNE